MKKFLDVAVEAAREAGTMLRAEFGCPKQISYKGEVDIVTESDRRAEALIAARLRREFPDHAIIAEEGTVGAAAGAKFTWHVDPLDGTTNFAHGYPCFGVSIGLVQDGKPLVGAVLNPVADEMFTAMRGEGAYLNGTRIQVSPIEALAESLVCTGFPPKHRRSSVNMSYYWEFTLRSHGVRRDGSAALDLCAVACGRFEAFWEFGLNSWDTSAGMLMVTEAGGTVTDLSGAPYQPGDKEMLATNGRIHDEMQQVIVEIAQRDAES